MAAILDIYIVRKFRKLFIISRGNKWDRGNRNIKLIPREKYFEILIKYPWDSSWIKVKALLGRRYIPMLKELIELCEEREEMVPE